MITVKNIFHGWIPSSLCALIIAYASLYPYGALGLRWKSDDWIQHSIAYIVLSFLLSFPVKTKLNQTNYKKRALIVILSCVFFGIILELGQFLSPGRTPSVIDGLINLIGSGIGQAIYIYTRLED